MELRQYWDVIWRRRWLVGAIVVLVGLFSAITLFTTPKTYRVDTVFQVRQELTPGDAGVVFYGYDRYYWWLGSEYLVDDYTQLVHSDSFGQAVIDSMKKLQSENKLDAKNADKLKDDINKLSPMDVSEAIGADRTHRELRVFATTNSPDLSKAMMNAAGLVLTTSAIQPVSANGQPRGKSIDNPVIAQIDNVDDFHITTGTSREIANAAIRVILGIVVALALAFLLEYLDNSVRDERDARRVLDLPVLGTIPRT